MKSTTFYDGWAIEMRDDLGDEEVTKKGYEAVKGDQRRTIDISPYVGFAQGWDQACAVIALGFPTREDAGTCGPLRQEDIDKLWSERMGNKPKPVAQF